MRSLFLTKTNVILSDKLNFMSINLQVYSWKMSLTDTTNTTTISII